MTLPRLRKELMRWQTTDGSLHWIDIKPGKTKAGEWWFAIKIGGPKMGNPAAPTMRPIDQHSKAKGNAFVSDNDDDIPF